MLSKSSRRPESLFNCQLLSACRLNTPNASIPQRGVLARYRYTDSNSDDHESPSRPSMARRFDRGDQYKRKRPQKKQRVNLEHNFLGKPATVVVVPERARRSQTKKPAQPQPEANEDELPLFLQDLGQDKTPPNNIVIAERIESLLSPHNLKDKLSTSDYEDLRSRVLASFTVPQLADYVSRKNEGGFVDLEASSSQRESPSPGQWKPGTSLFLETGPVSQERVSSRTAAKQVLTNKELLAERVLRDCWEIGVVSEIGQLDIRLPTAYLALLISSRFFSFEDLASLHGVTIDVTRSLGLVRVTGKQRACEIIREITDDYTYRIQSEELDTFLPPGDARAKAVAQTLTPDFYSWMARTYKVAFEEGSSPVPTRLYYLSERKTKVQDARRTLNLAINKAMSTSVPFSTHMPASEPSELRDFNVEQSAAWHDRQQSWVRWQKTVDKAHFAQLPSYMLSAQQTPLPAEILKVLRQAPSANANSRPGLEVRESITATVGKCLFLRNPFLEEKQASASQLGQISLARTFVKHVSAATLLRTLTPRAIDRSHSIHRMRLVPTALHMGVFPTLDFEFAVPLDITKEEGTPYFRSVKATLAESHVDYLLPESVADLRFTRKLTHELLNKDQPNTSLNEVLEDLTDRFRQTLTTNKEIPVPAFKQITLPNRLLRQDGETLDPESTSTAEYMAQPINDIQGTLVSQYVARSNRVLFTSYEGGPYDAPLTTDLFLELESKDQSVNSEAQSVSSNQVGQREFTSFYTTACTVVSELDFAQ